MNVRFVRLISGSREGLPEGFPDFRDELRYLKERHGEKIAALDDSSGTLLGSVSLSRDRDVGGHFFRLAAIDVSRRGAEEGVEAALLEEAKAFISQRHMSRMKLGTSPLLTGHAALYITRFGARYRWREGIKTPDGRPRPYVSCECDFEDPSARPLDLTEEEVAPRSVLSWDGLRPIPRHEVVYRRPVVGAAAGAERGVTRGGLRAGPRAPACPLERLPRPLGARLRLRVVRSQGPGGVRRRASLPAITS